MLIGSDYNPPAECAKRIGRNSYRDFSDNSDCATFFGPDD